jgi:glucose/sorbosone dehydrogenase
MLSPRACLLTALTIAASISHVGEVWAGDASKGNPLDEWSVRDGYSLSVAARGFELPTEVTAIKTPGSAPSSPRFFVAELRGKIKAIANDGTVSDLTTISTFLPKAEWPDYAGEAGLGSLCLDPAHGYLFATYAYRDPGGVLRNGIARFSLQPGTFEGKPSDPRNYSEPLAKTPGAFSHQIGSCIVDTDSVLISIGDGGNPAKSHDLDTPLGKIIRLTLDGAPYPQNPFYSAGGFRASVYAYGLRNTFGLSLVAGRLFAAENGIEIDRFEELRAGADHGWDGSDPSITMNALAIFSPTVGPAHLVHAEPVNKVFEPSTADRFLIAASNGKQGPGVINVSLDLKQNVVVETPRYFVHYDGDAEGQGIAGIALTDDGLYFAPLLPVGESGVVFVTRYDPPKQHTSIIGKKAGDPLAKRACLGCHSLNGVGGRVGPPLDYNSVYTRTETKVLDPSYAKIVEGLDKMTEEAVVIGHQGRHEVLDAPRDLKVRTWVINRIMNPKFDMPDAQMPTLGIERKEAEQIADRLIGSPPRSKTSEVLHSGRFLAGFAGGAALSAGCCGILLLFVLRRRKKPVPVAGAN